MFNALGRMLLGIATAASLIVGSMLMAPAATAQPATATKAGVTAPSSTERAANCNWRRGRCFSAISINLRSGKAFWSSDRRTREGAVSAAYRKCRNNTRAAWDGACRRATWVRNGCIAVAWRYTNKSLGRYEWSSGYAKRTKAAAIRSAKYQVRGPGTEHLWSWVCTTRYYG